MTPIDYPKILEALKAERRHAIAKLDGTAHPLYSATLRQLAEVQAAIAAIEADERDSLPAGQR